MRVAIVGAGATGLAAGRRLAGRGHEVVVYEQSRAIGGRTATRRTHGCVIDHGAQYVTTPDDVPEVRRLVLDDLPRAGLVDIGRPVWTFDRAGRVQRGDPRQNAEPKWTYAEGLDALGKRLAAGLEVRRAAGVARVQRRPGGYRLLDATGSTLGESAHVLVAIPAGQAVELMQASDVDAGRRDAVLAELQKVRYRSLLSIMLVYPHPPHDTVFAGGTPEDPRPYYALVNTDRGHDVSWLAIENDKGPARVPAETLALVVQMSGGFSAAHFDAAPEHLAARAAEAARSVLGLASPRRGTSGRPSWYDVARWRYALPDVTCDLAALNRDHDGLFFAGDYVAGGRVHLALQAGLDVAALLAAG
jgi:predicted NAD/FAD-dependent oxidoreductase